MKIPFGIAQIGKAFRNEIVARQFLFRMREFEQMEMQFFVKPGEELEWFAYWKLERMKWHTSLGIPAEKYRFHDHEKLAHYANAATDIEFEFPIGFQRVRGNPFTHRFRPERPPEILRQETSVFRYRDE
jgi:glycyl-tRNA synthetase